MERDHTTAIQTKLSVLIRRVRLRLATPDLIRGHVWDHPDTLDVSNINEAAKALNIGPVFEIGDSAPWWEWPNLPNDHPMKQQKVECLTIFRPDKTEFRIRRDGSSLDRPFQKSAADEAANCLQEWEELAVQIETDKSPPNSRTNDLPAHSPDFASVNWFGDLYEFTTNQAACIKELWEAWENKAPILGEATIQEAADVNSALRVVFRGHPAWGKMIVQGTTKGRFRLSEPQI